MNLTVSIVLQNGRPLIYITSMRIQEFDNLADWFKENVLDVPNTNDESYVFEVYEEPDIDDASLAHSVAEKPTEADDELSLIQYIIGIDEIK